MTTPELDVRPLRKPEKHPAIFATFDALAVGESFVLVNNHDPKHLRDEFEIDRPRGFGWEYLARGPEAWRIQISKLAQTPLPRVLCDSAEVIAGSTDAGAVWKLTMRERDLDSNIVRVAADSAIESHVGPDLDVLLMVLDGSGRVVTEVDDLELERGALVWLPRGSRRSIAAGADGLCYLSVHQRRQSLQLTQRPD